MHVFRRVVLWVLFSAVVLSAPVCAQETALAGTVTDPQGAIVPGATATLTNTATGAVRTTTTKTDGTYLFPQLNPGTYRLEIKMQGFKTSVREKVNVPVGLTTTLDLSLEIGKVEETVVVEAEAARLNTTDASLGNVFLPQQVLNLPLLNLDPSGLLSLQAGVTFVPSAADEVGGYSGTNRADGRGGSVSGSRSDQSNITLDGVDVNDPQYGYAFTSVLRATQASLQEFRVTTTNYDATQGRSGAAQVQLVTKSGTNELHGLGYWAHRNEIFNANDWFLNRDGVDRGKFRRHIYGAALGGPIKKDRIFLFGNWEELRENLSEAITRSVPSMAFRDGVLIYPCADPLLCPGGTVAGLSNTHTIPAGHYGLTPLEMAAIDPLNATGEGPNADAIAYFRQFPEPNAPGSFDRLNIVGYSFNAPVVNFFRTWIARADVNIDRNGNHTLFWRGTMQDDNFTYAGPQLPGEPINQIKVNGNKGFALSYRTILNPNLINTVRWGYTRISEQVAGHQASDYVNFRFLSNLEDYASDTFGRIVPQHHLRDDVSWSRGAHTLSFGADLRFTRNKRFDNVNSFNFFTGNPSWLPNVGRNLLPGATECQEPGCAAVPAVDSSAEAAYTDSAMHLLGILSQATAYYNFDRTGATLPTGDPVTRRFAVNEWEAYFQDQWRLHPTLTFTYGFRYLIISPPWETNGNQVSPSPSLSEWFETRRQLMLAGVAANKAPQISFVLGGPVNGGKHYYDYDYNNWSPRLAAAWSPHFKEGWLGKVFGEGKTVIRAGWSIVYDRIGNGLVTSFDAGGSFGMSTGIDSVFGGCGEGPSTAGPLGVCPRFTGVFDTAAVSALLPPSPGGSFPATPPGADLFGVPQAGSFAITSALDDAITTPYAHTINFSIARSLPWDLSVEAAYVGRRGRNQMIISDLAMPSDLRDPQSGVSYFQAAQQLIALEEQGQNILALAPIPYWENLFPSFGPTGVNGGFLPCDIQGADPGGTGGFSATQVAYDLMNCSHPDTTVFPYLIDNFGYPGYALGGSGDLDLDSDGFPDAPFAFFDDQFATLTAWRSIARSEYHGFQLSVRKRMSHGVMFDINYTLAKSLDMSSTPERTDIFGGTEFGAGYSGTTINSWNPDLEYSFSDFDMRHQFNTNWTVELPFGKGRKFAGDLPTWADQILGGWDVSGVMRLSSGLPATVINARVWPTNWNIQGNATCKPASASRFGVAVGPCPSTQNVHGATHLGTPGVQSPNLFGDPDAAFDNFRFTLPGLRGERNIIRGDTYFNLDFAVQKTFRMPWEGHRFTFRWETFNLTNTPTFDTGNLSANIARKATFGDYLGVLGGPRRMQFTLRYEF
ncbi:MAG TPA: carboxypeptidase-like regulatory domain-containing protein [Terriglobia bacterium]